MTAQKKNSPRIAHKSPGRLRIKLPSGLDKKQTSILVDDLKVSPDVSNVTLRGTSLIIEHTDDEKTMTAAGKALNKLFPEFERWSDDLDTQIAKITADPWVNKTIPLGFVGLAVYTAVRSGSLLAGESAFALAYVGFDLYWKFQQENVVRKIEQGLSKRAKEDADGSS